MEELKAAVTDKQGKISKFDNNKSSGSGQRERSSGGVRSNLRDKEGNQRPAAAAVAMSKQQSQVQGNSRFSSPHSNSSQKSQKKDDTSRSHGPGAAERRISHHRQDDYRRSRSMGPLENRDKSHLRQRSRSRGFHDPSPDRDKSRSGQRHHPGEDRQTRSKSRGRPRHESFNSGSRGRPGQVRGDQGRGRGGMPPPSPAEAEEAIAKLLPRSVSRVSRVMRCHAGQSIGPVTESTCQ